VQVAGDGLFSYQWKLNGTNLPPVIITVAGNGTSGFSGDGGAATNAQMAGPYGVALDMQGNLYFSDNFNHRVRKVDTNGIISTFAGTGVSGSTGNGGQATNATLRNPQGMTFDKLGNLYFAGGNSDIRMIDTNGIIRLVAGAGAVGHSGDGGYATNTALGQPSAVAVDSSGNFYLNDYYYWRIRKVGSNNIISTVAGTLSSGFSGDGGMATNANLGQPSGVALDSVGRIIIADYDNYRVRMVDTSGIITTIVGSGTNYLANGIQATNASLKPISVAVDPWNNVCVTDGNLVRMVDTNGIITTVAIGAQAMAFDARGNLFIADRANLRIRKVCFTGLPTLLVPNSSTNNAGNYSVVISSPFGSVVSSVANLTVFVPPQQFTGRSTSGGLQIQFSGTPNYPYILQSATNLTSPVNWLPVLTNPADGNGNWQFTDTNLNGNQKFYRAVGQ
jgi:sugar lactone lactonase YvrE